MPGPRNTIGPPHAHRILDRRTALAQIGGAMALGCAAPSLAHPTGKKDHRMTWFALATRAGADGPRPVIQVGDAFHDLHDAAAAHGFAAAAGDVSAIIRDWDARRDPLFALARALDGVSGAMEPPRLAAPFEPRRIFAAASNFIEHAEEMQTKLAAKADSEPYIFPQDDRERRRTGRTGRRPAAGFASRLGGRAGGRARPFGQECRGG